MPENIKVVRCYHSWSNIIPNASNNDGVVTNPGNLTFNESIEDVTQMKTLFKYPALFMTFEPL